MNQWVAHLCSACNLEKQDDDYCGGIQNLIYSRQGNRFPSHIFHRIFLDYLIIN